MSCCKAGMHASTMSVSNKVFSTTQEMYRSAQVDHANMKFHTIRSVQSQQVNLSTNADAVVNPYSSLSLLLYYN